MYGLEESTPKSCKVRLFGFELESEHVPETSREKGSVEGDESMDSSSMISSSSMEKSGSDKGSIRFLVSEDKKLECQYCLKVFGCSQALGGHQNAHKKERMRKKRLQLQARKASINYCIQPPLKINKICPNSKFTINYYGSNNSTWLYDPSTCRAYPESAPVEKSPISFRPNDSDDLNIIDYENSRDRSSEQRNIHTFSLSSANGSMKEKIRPSSWPGSKKISDGKSSDLQLGLSLHSTV